MKQEIERKFRLLGPPPPDLLHTHAQLSQGYLPSGMRVRRTPQQIYLCMKSEGDLSRQEWEVPIPIWVWASIWPHTEGRRLEKTRYLISWGGYLLEVDQYHDSLEGLWTMECEFESKDDAKLFVLPPWAQDAEEVTYDIRYRNAVLAQDGLP